MLKTVEATIDANGKIHLHEPLNVSSACRAIVTIIEEPKASETALLSQPSLARDWDRAEEDEAWSHLR